MFVILLFLIAESWPVLGRISPLRFFTDESWHPLEGAYHLMPMLAGTLYASIGAIVLAIPQGIASALFIALLRTILFGVVVQAFD